jgi:DegV family protein with EDD domain
MKYKIVTDSAANLGSLHYIAYSYAPLHIIADEQDFEDTGELDLAQLQAALHACKRSSTACPSVGAYLDAFGDAEIVFCVTMTGTLSGSHSAALLAKEDYEKAHPGRQVYVLDSLSAGPEMLLMAEKLQELILANKQPEEIVSEINAYMKRSQLLFVLQSLDNLARNGRVSPVAAKFAHALGIRVVGEASEAGELALLAKCRGEKSALLKVAERMHEAGYAGGKVYIAHCRNESAAKQLAALIKLRHWNADVRIGETRALCTYYAEEGGLMVGYET